MIDLNNDTYITVLIEAGKILDGTFVYKPSGDVRYILCTEEPDSNCIVNTDTKRYGRGGGKVYLKHSNNKYYAYPKKKLLRVRIDKYDLQRIIDNTSEY